MKSSISRGCATNESVARRQFDRLPLHPRREEALEIRIDGVVILGYLIPRLVLMPSDWADGFGENSVRYPDGCVAAIVRASLIGMSAVSHDRC
jgi:hypothetical protein